MAKKIDIPIDKFYEKFADNYEFLYDNDDNVAGYDEALEAGEKFLSEHGEFMSEFARYRGEASGLGFPDPLTSDRELAAFAFTMADLGIEF